MTTTCVVEGIHVNVAVGGGNLDNCALFLFIACVKTLFGVHYV